jgi:nucleotide-binding universal stress UspA family protein
MAYKTILVHVDQSKNLEKRVKIAADIAIAEDALLIGVAATGISRFIQDTTIGNPMDPAMGPSLDKLRDGANNALATFEAIARKAGVASFAKRVIDDDAVSGISLRARYCDLTILGQEDPDERSPALVSGFPEYVTMGSGTGTLIVPYAGDFKTVGERVLIAWNASSQALHAVRAALPILRRAKGVDVVVFNSRSRKEIYGEEPGADIALFLARHGVKVNVMQEEIGKELDVGNALLSLAATHGSDLLVMGCYGHSRFREMLLGGATRVIMESMTLPVLMTH